MKRVAYCNPFVPPEWIAAHGLAPVWLMLDGRSAHGPEATRRGICPCVAALLARAADGIDADALVLTTVCDQMRYASAYLESQSGAAQFLMNVPSTWQASGPRALYRQELERLGAFLVKCGGRTPTNDQLAETIERYERERLRGWEKRPLMTARQWSETVLKMRGELPLDLPLCEGGRVDGIRLVVIGGPVLAEDGSFLDMIEEAGGWIVSDGTETGERTLPVRGRRERLQIDPLDELVRIYFDTIPDPFRRPNTVFYDWLGERIAAASARGVILRRYPFCDLWHGEAGRIRQWSPVPVLDLDVAVGDEGEGARTRGRIEAFLEMLA